MAINKTSVFQKVGRTLLIVLILFGFWTSVELTVTGIYYLKIKTANKKENLDTPSFWSVWREVPLKEKWTKIWG